MKLLVLGFLLFMSYGVEAACDKHQKFSTLPDKNLFGASANEVVSNFLPLHKSIGTCTISDDTEGVIGSDYPGSGLDGETIQVRETVTVTSDSVTLFQGNLSFLARDIKKDRLVFQQAMTAFRDALSKCLCTKN